jgi:hypothetical protein
MKVYLVYSGRFDDHGLDGVFSTKQLAQQFVDDGKCVERDGIHIDEWELDNPPVREEEPQQPFFNVFYYAKTQQFVVREVRFATAVYCHRVVEIRPGIYVTSYQLPNAEEALEDGRTDIMQFIEEAEK